jgi:hypothetical protein
MQHPTNKTVLLEPLPGLVCVTMDFVSCTVFPAWTGLHRKQYKSVENFHCSKDKFSKVS